MALKYSAFRITSGKSLSLRGEAKEKCLETIETPHKVCNRIHLPTQLTSDFFPTAPLPYNPVKPALRRKNHNFGNFEREHEISRVSLN